MKSSLCYQARTLNHHGDALCCFDSPYPDPEGVYTLKTLVEFRGIVIYCSFFKNLKFHSSDRGYWVVKGNEIAWRGSCPPTVSDVYMLIDSEERVLFLHSILHQTMRATRDAARATRDAAWVARDAARVARDTARKAYKSFLKALKKFQNLRGSQDE